MRTLMPLATWSAITERSVSRPPRRRSRPTVHRPRVHDDGVVGHGVQPAPSRTAGRTRAARGRTGPLPLRLDPEHHHHVLLRERDRVQVVGDGRSPGLDPGRQRGRRGDQGDLGPHGGEGEHVRAGDPLCSTSPTMATLSPSASARNRWRMVYRSSRAWVGCSWVPSPALTTTASTHSASRQGAPEAPWRITLRPPHRLQGDGGVLQALALEHSSPWPRS